MIPRAQMDVIDVDDPLDKDRPHGHRRRPLASRSSTATATTSSASCSPRICCASTEEGLRPARLAAPGGLHPESKRLNVLLREFRVSRNHMAIVVNEYGGVAGLVTIEDVLEQIVGDIEDEYDFDETHDNIRLDASGRYRVKARTEIEDFNEAFATAFSDEEFDTVGGLIPAPPGRVPKRNEIVDIDGVRFQVLRADSRRLAPCWSTPPNPERCRPNRLPERGSRAVGWRRCSARRRRLSRPLRPFWLAPHLGRPVRAAAAPDGIRARGCSPVSFGLGFFLCGVSWVYVSLSVFGGMPWWLAGPALPVLRGDGAVPDGSRLDLQAPATTAFLAASHPVRQPAGRWATGYAAGCSPVSPGWPSATQTPPSPLAGFAPLLGVFGLSWLVALSGALLCAGAAVAGHRFAHRIRLGTGANRRGPRRRRAAHVALVQGNIPQEMKFRPEAFFRTLELYRIDRSAPRAAHRAAGNRLPVFLRPVAGTLCPGGTENARPPATRRHHLSAR